MFKSKIILVSIIIMIVSCNNRVNEKNSKGSFQNYEIVTKEDIYNELKNKNYKLADSLADSGSDSISSFYLLLHALSEFGVDSVNQSVNRLKQYLLFDSSKCSQIIVEGLIVYLNSDDITKEFVLSTVIDSLEFENIEKVCSLLTITGDTYTVTVTDIYDE